MIAYGLDFRLIKMYYLSTIQYYTRVIFFLLCIIQETRVKIVLRLHGFIRLINFINFFFLIFEKILRSYFLLSYSFFYFFIYCSAIKLLITTQIPYHYDFNIRIMCGVPKLVYVHYFPQKKKNY